MKSVRKYFWRLERAWFTAYSSLKKTFDDLYRAADFWFAKRKLLSSAVCSGEEKALLRRVSLRVHPTDGMYSDFGISFRSSLISLGIRVDNEMYVSSPAQHYFSVGLSAMRAIEGAIVQSNRDSDVGRILDFPCGYGRVLRFLRARFPAASITASDIDPVALDFCSHTFSVKSLLSNTDLKNLSMSEKFDLIWCGSLITHLNEKAAADLLKFFHDHLLPNGLCIFTTHGKLSAELIRTNAETYGLTVDAQRQVLSQFYDNGYGYADYSDQPGYGISLVSHEQMLSMADKAGAWNETYYVEHGWDYHQDVYGLIMTTDKKRLTDASEKN
jgi:SAM-dependent methyltransferase